MENCFLGQIRADWGNTAQVDTARLGSMGLYIIISFSQ